jgi:cell division protein FtsL
MSYKSNQKNPLLRILLWPFRSYLRILVVVAIIGLYQYQSIQIDILAREIRSLELKRNQLINEKATLQVQIDQLTHINRIEKLAKEKFGLIASGQDLEKLIIHKFDAKTKFTDKEHKVNIKLAGVQ